MDAFAWSRRVKQGRRRHKCDACGHVMFRFPWTRPSPCAACGKTAVYLTTGRGRELELCKVYLRAEQIEWLRSRGALSVAVRDLVDAARSAELADPGKA